MKLPHSFGPSFPVWAFALLHASVSLASGLPDTMLLENVPPETEIQLTQDVVVKYSGGLMGDFFSIDFRDGNLLEGTGTAHGLSHLSGKPPVKMAATTETLKTGYCSYSEDPGDFAPERSGGSTEVEFKVPQGVLFTVRSASYPVAQLATAPDSNLKRTVYLFNKPTGDRLQRPHLSCFAVAGKATVRDLGLITGNLIKLIPGK